MGISDALAMTYYKDDTYATVQRFIDQVDSVKRILHWVMVESDVIDKVDYKLEGKAYTNKQYLILQDVLAQLDKIVSVSVILLNRYKNTLIPVVRNMHISGDIVLTPDSEVKPLLFNDT